MTDEPRHQRAYKGYSLMDQPVLMGEQDERCTATISQDSTGALNVRVAREPQAVLASVFSRSRPAIRSAPGEFPSVFIERAAIRTPHLTPDASYNEVWAAQVSIRNTEVQPTDEIQKKFYLTGLNFTDETTSLAVGGFTWTLRLLDDHLETGRVVSEGRGAVTAVLASGPFRPARASDVEDAASLITFLLSFAAGGFVRVARIDEERSGTVTATTLRRQGEPDAFSLAPILLESAEPGVVKHFVESTYPSARSVSKVIPLTRLIASALRVREERVVHTKGLLAANFLEVVRFHHALNVLVTRGRAVQDGELFRDARSRRPLSFDTIIGDFVHTHALTRWDPKFTKFRNRVVHGDEIKGATLLDQHAAVMELAHFCDTVVLALLDWDKAGGSYIPCNDWERATPTSYGINVLPFAR